MAAFKLTLVVFVIIGISLSLGVHGLKCYHCGRGNKKSENCTDGEIGESKKCGLPQLVCYNQTLDGKLIDRGCVLLTNGQKLGSFSQYPGSVVRACDTDNCNGDSAGIGTGGSTESVKGSSTSTGGGRSCGVQALPGYYFAQMWGGFLWIVIAIFSGSFIASQ